MASSDAEAGFLARYWAEIASRPARLVAALMATAMAPVLVIEVSTVARATAELGGHEAPTPPAEAPPQAVVPVAGDADSWLAGARKAAATCPGLPPEVLVAIAKVETGLGIRTDTSYAGAVGPMQFLPGTWAAYGVDGDGDGRADVMNVVDALHGAARLLCANGGGDPHRLRTAVWHYNRSLSYVERVTTLAGHAASAAVE
jgi:soluble lytic murein transglycosylase-like protein